MSIQNKSLSNNIIENSIQNTKASNLFDALKEQQLTPKTSQGSSSKNPSDCKSSESLKKNTDQASYFTKYFKDTTQKFWNSCSEELSPENFGQVDSKSNNMDGSYYLLSIKDDNKLVKINLKVRENYLFATSKNKKSELETYNSDMNYIKMEVLELDVSSDEKKNKKLYGILFTKNEIYEEIYHTSKEKIVRLFYYLKKYCILFNLKDDFKVNNQIGSGNFSKVYEAERIFDNKKFALKVINKKEFDTKSSKKRMMEEISILRHISNTDSKNKDSYLNIDSIYEGKSSIYIVSNIFEGQNLFEYYKENRNCFSEKDCIKIMKSLLESLVYLQSKGIMHRDIKPANLVMKTKDNFHELAIVDYGLSLFKNEKNSNGLSNDQMAGTPGYICPEMLKQQEYDYKCDVFSAGCTFYMLLFGKQIFYKKDRNECLELNKECPVKDMLIKDLKKNSGHQYNVSVLELLINMLEPIQSDRMYAHELLELPIFDVIKELDNNSNENIIEESNNNCTKIAQENPIQNINKLKDF